MIVGAALLHVSIDASACVCVWPSECLQACVPVYGPIHLSSSTCYTKRIGSDEIVDICVKDGSVDMMASLI